MEMALDLDGISRQWKASRNEVAKRAIAGFLADNGRVVELGRMKMAEETARAAVADLQDMVARLERDNLDKQKELEKAQAALRDASGAKAPAAVEPKAATVARARHLHPELEGLAERAGWTVEEKVDWSQKNKPGAIGQDLMDLRTKAGSWPEALKAAQAAAAALGVRW